MKNHHRLTLADREEISRGLANQETLTSIAQRIGKDKSALSYEVNRDGMTKDTYRAHKAIMDWKIWTPNFEFIDRHCMMESYEKNIILG